MPSTPLHSYKLLPSPSQASKMEELQAIPVQRPIKIIRRSIYSFLKHYQYFTSVAFLVFPFSASILLFQAFLPSSSLLPTIQNRLGALFAAAGFPPSSKFFNILNLKVSQTITSSILVLPFSLSFLLLAKASVIQFLNDRKAFSSFSQILSPLFITQLWNSIFILSANATCFSLLFIAFNCLDGFDLLSPTSLLFLSATFLLLYSIFLANALIISNLALVLSGMEKCSGGYIAILKACVLLKGKSATALSLALPINMALAGVEALFQYRVVSSFHKARDPNSSMMLEGMFIAYLYSIFIVLDTIMSCVFFKSCRSAYLKDLEGGNSIQIEIEDEYASDPAKVKSLEGLP
ncbi:hypothetical protein RJ639_041810 [Escallonia herrerae]|uniref:Transmembrane protein n=1 Tax=Escallonia herrerae TaxID=1293975 RepID=A0AA88WJV1_9ASTE|nr:hypothetical protein RJ639_041810 [Escallonia herrerae]